jgi:hypothetical protein
VVRSIFLILQVLGSNLCFYTFFDQLSAPNGGGGGRPICGRGAGVAGPCGRGVGVVGPCGGGRLTGVGPTTMLTGPDRWGSTTMLTGPDRWGRLPC